MQNVSIQECGAITGAAEMIRLRDELVPIWDVIRREHPVEVLSSAIEEEDLAQRVARAVSSIPRIEEKRSIIVAGPELLALEAVAMLGLGSEVILAVDATLSESAVTRVARNVPQSLRVKVSRSLPMRHMGPSDSVLVAVGLRGGYRFALTPAWIASVVRRYSAVFSGERILIDALGQPVNWRRSGWLNDRNSPGWVTEMIESLFTDVAVPPQLESSYRGEDCETRTQTLEVTA